MSSKTTNKDFVRRAQALLKTQGNDVSLGHLYEMFAKLSGHNDWNTAAAAGTTFGFNSDEASIREIVNHMHQENKRLHEGRKNFPVIEMSLQCTATVYIHQSFTWEKNEEVTPEVIEAAKLKFIQGIKDGTITEATISEPPVEPHDYKFEDIEIDDITTCGAQQEAFLEHRRAMPFLEKYKRLVQLKEIEEIEEDNGTRSPKKKQG